MPKTSTVSFHALLPRAAALLELAAATVEEDPIELPADRITDPNASIVIPEQVQTQAEPHLIALDFNGHWIKFRSLYC